MAHKGPAVPSQPRTLRGRSLDIGTIPAGFEGGVAYDPQAGHPTGPDYPPAQHYEHVPGHGTTEGGAKPIQSNPIKLG